MKCTQRVNVSFSWKLLSTEFSFISVQFIFWFLVILSTKFGFNSVHFHIMVFSSLVYFSMALFAMFYLSYQALTVLTADISNHYSNEDGYQAELSQVRSYSIFMFLGSNGFNRSPGRFMWLIIFDELM